MNNLALVKITTMSAAALLSTHLWAAECSEVVWTEDMLAKYPNIDQYCLAVVEKGGRELVEFDAKFISSFNNKAKLKFKKPDGTYGETFETDELPSDLKIVLSGKPTRVRDIPRNSELTILMPPDRFELASQDDYQYQEPQQLAMLPDTGSMLPLVGILGFLASGLGLALTVFRKRKEL